MKIKYEYMQIEDYDEIFALWKESKGVGLSNADKHENINIYLKRNQGHSYVAKDEDTLVGVVLAGHDGRRGYIHHLTVKESYRKKGIGKELINKCLESLKEKGIQKCHLFVFNKNLEAIKFWKKSGWIEREDIAVMSKNL